MDCLGGTKRGIRDYGYMDKERRQLIVAVIKKGTINNGWELQREQHRRGSGVSADRELRAILAGVYRKE